MRPTTCFAILTLAALPLVAQPGPGRGMRPQGPQQALALTEAQRTTIRDLREKQRPEMIRLHEAQRKARLDLMEALRKPEATPAALRPLYDKAAAARFDQMMAQRALRQAVAGVLTPEQRAQAQAARPGPGRGMGMMRPSAGPGMGPRGAGRGMEDCPMGAEGGGPGRPGPGRW